MPCLKILASMNNVFKVYCNVCTSSVDMKCSNYFKQHIESKKHTKSVLLKRRRRVNIEANFGKLSVFMETHFGRKIPYPKTLACAYVDWGYNDLLQKLNAKMVITIFTWFTTRPSIKVTSTMPYLLGFRKERKWTNRTFLMFSSHRHHHITNFSRTSGIFIDQNGTSEQI